MQVAAVIFNTNQSSVLKQFLQILAANSLQWAHDSWGGYNKVNYNGEGNTVFLYVNPVLNNSAAAKSMTPMTDWAAGLGNSTVLNSVFEVPSFLEFYAEFLASGGEVRYSISSHPTSKLEFCTILLGRWSTSSDFDSVNSCVELTDYRVPKGSRRRHDGRV
jgi:hypothetical protein